MLNHVMWTQWHESTLNSTIHFNYIHCRDHGLALCFVHLIPHFDEFKSLDSLLLNLYLLSNNSSKKQSIFNEVQSAYGLDSLKLIKTAVICWLSHGTIAQQVLDCLEPLVASLDAIYLQKYEPAVHGLCDCLIQPNMIATLCFLTDVLKSKIVLQTIVQGSQLNLVAILNEVQKLPDTLILKADNPMQPAGCYFSKISDFLEIVSKSSEACYKNHSSVNNKFDNETFVSQTVRPFL